MSSTSGRLLYRHRVITATVNEDVRPSPQSLLGKREREDV
jgi:hypothetical protein